MTKKCPKCGAQLEDIAKFCTKCGCSLTEINSKDKIEATPFPKENNNSKSTKNNSKKIKIDPTNKQSQEPDSGINAKTVGIVGLIAIGVIIIVAAMSFMPSGSDVAEEVTISVTQTESYATNEVNYTTANLTETGNLEYWYYVNANLYPSDLSMDLEEYDAKITFYSGSEVITAVEAYIYKYDDGTFDVTGSYTTKELANVTDIQIEVINPTGDIVGSQKSQFTMGDMSTARF